ELMELLAHGLFIEHAEHGIFPVDRRHNRNAEVDWALWLAILHAETAVLRDAALGYIELAHDLDTRNDRRMMLLRDRRHGLGQDAVNAELDADGIVAGLDVDIAGPPLQSGEDRGIDKPDDGADVALGGEAVDGNTFVTRALFFRNDVQAEAFAGVFQNALGLLSLLEDLADLPQRGNLGDDAFAEQQADFVNHHQLTGIGNRNGESSVAGLFE